jgi:hypothetical protein
MTANPITAKARPVLTNSRNHGVRIGWLDDGAASRTGVSGLTVSTISDIAALTSVCSW